MMRVNRYLLCVTLILCLLVSAVSMTAFATDGTAMNGLEAVTKSGNLSGENNSHLADVVKDGVQSTKLNENHLSMIPSNTTAGDPITGDLYPSHFQTYGPVCEELREALKLRKSEIYLYYCLDRELTEADFDALMIDAATGMGDWNDYGDYLMHSVLDYGYYAEYIQSEGLNYYVIGYAVAYLTTFEQEQELEQKIMELKPVILEGAENSYQRIKAIHDYIAANVSYDLDNAMNPDYLLQHSAYAALMHGKCSAQGFTMLFYRMAELYDLHCRIILGSVDGMPFMWNMVRFDLENWYNVNMAADVLDGTDAYFMKGTSDFPDNHQPADFYLTPEFMEKFPISEAGLDPECALSGSAGDNVTWRFNAVTNEFIVSGQGKMKDELCLSHEVQNAQNLALVVEEGITYIGSRSFEGGIFTSVALPDSLTEIGKYAFCESPITSVSGGKNIAKIDEGAFLRCYKLTDYRLPDNVESVGVVAFYEVPIEEVFIPAKLTSIGQNAFYHEKQTGYKVDENNTAFSAQDGILYNKDKTTLLSAPVVAPESYTLPDTLTSIGNNAFDGRNWLGGIKLPAGVSSIGKEAFKGSWNLTVELPESMTVINEAAFSGAKLYSIYIPETVEKIEKQAFAMSDSIGEIYYGGTQEQWDAITIEEGNDYLTSAQLHTETYGVSGSGWTLDLTKGALNATNVFDKNGKPQPWYPWKDSIASVEFGEYVYHVFENAFNGYTNLKTIRFTLDAFSIWKNAFAGCTALTDVYYNESESKWKEQKFDQAFPDSPNMTVHYKALPTSGSWGDNAKWTYDEKTGVLVVSGQGVITGENRSWEHWADYVKVIIVEEGITEIGSNAFQWCSKAVRLVIGDGVTTIGQNALWACMSLQDITVPVSLQSVAADNLSRNYNEYADVHYKGTEEQWNAIDFHTGNEKFTEANIFFETTCDHDMVIEMGKAATCTEEGLSMSKYCKVCNVVFAEQRTVPKAAHEWSYDRCKFCGEDVFAGRSSEGQFGDGLTWSFNRIDNRMTISGEGAIPDYADGEETPWSVWTMDIKGVWIKDGITAIGNNAFNGCVNMRFVSGAENVTRIGHRAFSNCYALSNMNIENRVTDIGDFAFNGCVSMYEVKISGSVQTIGKDAFKDCNLKRVIYKGSESAWKAVEVGTGNEALLNARISFAQPVDYVTNPFTDVANTDWFANPVLWAYDTGVTGGTSDTTFGPNNSCTRAQVVTFLYAAAGKPEVTTTDNPFEDVADNAWYLKPVLWAVENGITSGVDATHFGPDKTCTRAQVVTFLYAAAGKPEITASSDFNDVADSDWFAKPVIWAKENDVTGGVSEGMFGPNQTCTRAQVVTFLYKVYG